MNQVLFWWFTEKIYKFPFKFSCVKSNGCYIFQLFRLLEETGRYISQFLEALKVTGHYIFQLFSTLKVTGCCIFQLFSTLKVKGRYIFQLLETLKITFKSYVPTYDLKRLPREFFLLLFHFIVLYLNERLRCFDYKLQTHFNVHLFLHEFT